MTRVAIYTSNMSKKNILSFCSISYGVRNPQEKRKRHARQSEVSESDVIKTNQN